MGTFSVWHWLILLLIFVPNLLFIPTVRKAGFSGWWVALSLIPVVGNILLLIFAYSKWPALDQTEELIVKKSNVLKPILPEVLNKHVEITSTASSPISNFNQPAPPSQPLKVNFATSAATTSVTSDDLWAQALAEYDSVSRKQGLWARLFSEAQGNEALVKANYLRTRVDEMQFAIEQEDERVEAVKRAEIAKEQALIEAKHNQQRMYAALPKGVCSNCKAAILPLDTASCPKCRALFGLSSIYKVMVLSELEQLVVNSYSTVSKPIEIAASNEDFKWFIGLVVLIAALFFLSYCNPGSKVTKLSTSDASAALAPILPTAPAAHSNLTTNLVATTTEMVSQAQVAAKATTMEIPKFINFSVQTYSGIYAKVELIKQDSAFRTRLRDSFQSPINFAGEYTLILWGCGMDCTMGAAVSKRTGMVVWLPGTVCCWKGNGNNIEYRSNSKLIVLGGLINEEGKHAAHFYELKNDVFVPILSTPVTEVENK